MQDAVATQRMNGLLDANSVRGDRARLKREFKARTADPVRVLLDLPRSLERVSAEDYLTWVPWIGNKRARALCRLAQIARPEIELKRLGSHTRLRLAEELRAAIARQA